jgi:multimeric flavodoxin WrbA
MAEHVSEQLRNAGVKTESLRCVDYAILPGVQADMGDGDEWPKIRQKLLDAAFLVSPCPAGGRCPQSTPVWVGHPSSIAQRVLERPDAELSNTDDAGHPVMVGNEDGALKTRGRYVPGPQRRRRATRPIWRACFGVSNIRPPYQ